MLILIGYLTQDQTTEMLELTLYVSGVMRLMNHFPPYLSVLGMLKSLHQLQEENRRLEEQIKTLTMKKERLQLLSAQLSVPFTPTHTSSGKHTHQLISSFIILQADDCLHL